MTPVHRLSTTFAAVATALALSSCGKGQQAGQQQQMPPPEVGVVVAKAEAVPLRQELVGRLSALRSADVRARVAGILQKRVYTEGSEVKQGDLMFQIDPAPLRATLNAQLANLSAARATYQNAHVAAERARSVGAKGLISKADIDNANAAERTAGAAVKQAQANVESARINLGYANVTAPISGRSGKQQVTEGALVGQGDATLLTTIDQIDPLYVNFSQAVGVLDAVRRAAADGKVDLAEKNQAKITVTLPDGSQHGDVGSLDFSDTAVDASTGAVTLRGIVPNPDHTLLPGMYVNVKLELGEIKHAWLVPQLAVQRDTEGNFVMVVDGDGKTEQKHVTTDRLDGSNWVVTGGIADGDQIVVSGLQKLKPGAPAKATPWQPNPAPANASAPPSAAH